MKEYRVKVSVRNNLLLKAIEETGAKSVAEFCRNNGLTVAAVNAIVCMRVPPLNQSGEFSQIAKELMEILGACPTDLWSTEQLTLKINKSTTEMEIDFSSMRAALGGNSGFPILAEMPEESAQTNELTRLVDKALDTLTIREKQVLEMRYKSDMILEDIGNAFGVSRDRARQIEAKALRKLRSPNRSSSLKPYREGWVGELKTVKSKRLVFDDTTRTWHEEDYEYQIET